MIAAVTVILAAGIFLGASSASAVPDQCLDGTPPPCVDPEPPPPGPPSWDVEVLDLILGQDQDEQQDLGPVTADRSWLTTPVVGGTPTGGTTSGGTTTGGGSTGGGTAGTIPRTTTGGGSSGTAGTIPRTTTGGGTSGTAGARSSAPVIPSGGTGSGRPPGTSTTPYGQVVQAAGSATLDDGTLSFPELAMPAGAGVVLRLHEPGRPGSLCRTRVLNALPPSGQVLHLLAAQPETLAPSDLTALVADLVGPVAGLPAEITHADLTPSDAGLRLALEVEIVSGPDTMLEVDYAQLLGLQPVNSPDTGRAVTVTTPAPAEMELFEVSDDGGRVAIDPTDQLFIDIATLLRARVSQESRSKVTSALADRPDVRFWTDQGFTLSLRQVTTSDAGLTVEAALCRFGPR